MKFFTFGKSGRALLLSAAVGLLAVGCGDDDNPANKNKNNGDALSCGTRECGTVTIDGQTWMAENLNFKTAKSWCFKNADSNCVKYGRLYEWSAAKTACPSGWRLPDTSDWNKFVAAAGGSTAGKKLKSKSGRNENGNGTDDLGISPLPYDKCGSEGRSCSGDDSYVGVWWTAAEYDTFNAYFLFEDYDLDGNLYSVDDKSNAYTIRCVK